MKKYQISGYCRITGKKIKKIIHADNLREAREKARFELERAKVRCASLKSQ